MKTRVLSLAILAVLLQPLAAAAGPIFALGNECPTDAQMSGYTRQYYVTPALGCAYDTDDTLNIQGTNAEANLYLNGGPQPLFRTGWIGLGQDPAGFSFTADAGNDDGTFTISAAFALVYGQFALGVKDGGDPKFGIFVLPPGVLTGAWGFGTAAGDLSHFALYARGTPGPPNDEPPNDEPPSPVPEPASMLLLGTGLLAAARARARAR